MTNRPAPPPARAQAPTPPSIAGTVTAANSAQTPRAAAMTAAITSGDVLEATTERYRRRSARPAADDQRQIVAVRSRATG
jgi:hypothetical protein